MNPATNRITNAGMSCDANGNLTAMPGLTMTYNPDNRMISNSSGDSDLYDAAGLGGCLAKIAFTAFRTAFPPRFQ